MFRFTENSSKRISNKLDLLAVQEVRWVEGGSQPAADYTFFYRNENTSHHLGTSFFVHQGIRSAVKRVEFISNRMSHIALRSLWCDIALLNEHSPVEDKSDDTKDSLYEGRERVSDQFLKTTWKFH
jgi:hypothetical protein